MLAIVTLIQCLSIAAAEPTLLGHKGQGYFAGGGSFSVEGEHRSVSLLGQKTTADLGTVGISLSGGAFVIDRLSIGGHTKFTAAFGDQADAQTFAIGPVIGYVVPITQQFYWWPKLSGGFNGQWAKDATDPTQSLLGGYFEVDPSLVVSVAQNFGIYFGPYFIYQNSALSSDTSVTVSELFYGLHIGFTLWTTPQAVTATD